MEQKFDVFISYSSKDYVDENKTVIPGNIVSLIKDTLSKEGISYWFDEEGIYSGQNFTEKIVTNIEASAIFLFLSTANANESKWTCKEIAAADEFGKHIIPVRIDKTPYNKKVLFRIADLDYIEYYANPNQGLRQMVDSIKAYLHEIAAIRKRQDLDVAEKNNSLVSSLLTELGYVDLGLSSGTFWKNFNEEGFYCFEDAKNKYGDSVPTYEQWQELMRECEWEHILTGYRIKGRNGNYIELPFTGYKGRIIEYWSREIMNPNGGYYWSSSKDPLYSDQYSFQFDYSYRDIHIYFNIWYYFAIRLVKNMND